ncbi:hypothetical protein BP6252_03974 [Coleophoma cylindrospora]|uniref:Pathogen-related protein n=1 Tax=Coleophoma cylindrospora TaxID=1849047 RepID=A0A3D8S931_9HELO|nr:hypothetical protein BP6252_03974 [Coleophoma cylindrospora]
MAANIPDYCLNPNAVLEDDILSWRYGRAPDYTNTRKVYQQTRSQTHEPGSLEDIVENLVKNWEVEASFKQDINDWRTIDKDAYTFAINGGKPSSAEHMLRVGTYNAVITPNEYYSPEHSDFNSSHKTFKRMMPTFAWEVLEVFGAPPNISFKWRHWGVMKNDYVGFNREGEKVTVKAHGGKIDLQGMTVAKLTKDLRIQSLDTFFDPLELFEQIGTYGISEKVPVGRLGKYKLLPGESHEDYHGMDDHIEKFPEHNPLSENLETASRPQKHSEIHESEYHPPRPISPVGSCRSAQTIGTISFEEMSKLTPADCPFLMKWRSMSLDESSRAPSVHGDDWHEHSKVASGDPWGQLETVVATCETIVEEAG